MIAHSSYTSMQLQVSPSPAVQLAARIWLCQLISELAEWLLPCWINRYNLRQPEHSLTDRAIQAWTLSVRRSTYSVQ